MAGLHEVEIENFSCWSDRIHGECIKMPNITLYPSGLGGNGEHLVVKKFVWFRCYISEMSFIGSDGSVICTRPQDADSEGDTRIFTGPKFKEVVARIRGNEPLHKDRLILRWEEPQKYGSTRSRRVIDAYSVFFHVKPELLDLKQHEGNLKKSVSINEFFREIIFIPFTTDGDQDISYACTISACETGSTIEDTKVELKLKSYTKEKILARTFVWMQNGDNIMLKQEDECILVEGGSHILPYGIPVKELPGLKTIMCCKLITARYSDITFNREGQLSHGYRFICGNSFPRELLPENAVTALTKDFSSLYQDHDSSDFEVRCGTISFPTHRVILSARSPVLKAMLSGDLREAASGHMDIEDLDPHTLGCFLAFLYSGTCGEDLGWEEAINLFYAADKYLVPSLKKECAAVLCASVSLGNVCDILSLADKHQDEALRSVTHNFIMEYYNEVSGSENWEKLKMNDPRLVAKTVTHLAKKYIV